MATKTGTLIIDNLDGGMNDVDSPLRLMENQFVEARNINLTSNLFGKRLGATALSVTGSGLTGVVSSLIRHLPSEDEAEAELWAVDDDNVISRNAAGAWAAVTPADAISSRPQDVVGASLDGKLFLAFDSAVDRLHVWDGASLRRVGVGTPAAPTAANTAGAGTFAGTRYYRVRYIEMSGSDVIRRSEASPVLTFAPSGANVGVTVTKPAAISEGETHWELEASLDNLTFFVIATTAVGTTTYADTASSYSSGSTPNTAGLHIAPGSAKYVVADENRLILGGSWETDDYKSRIAWTPVIGSLDVGDSERVVATTSIRSYLDLDRGDGGGLTGLSEPLSGSVYAFKASQVYKLVRTGVAETPYLPVTVSKRIGALRHQTIVMAEDESGQPALYFLSRQGPYRIGTGGLRFLGRDISTTWSEVNLDATSVVGHGVYHADLKQIWWWVSTGSANDPDLKIVFHTELGRASVEGIRGGWVEHDGPSASARCSVMFANTVGASNSVDLKPYIGQHGGDARIWKCDSGLGDNGTNYAAYVLTRAYQPAGVDVRCGLVNGTVIAAVAGGVTIHAKVYVDFDGVYSTGNASIAPVSTELRCFRRLEDLRAGNARSVHFYIGDETAVEDIWTIDAVAFRWRQEEEV
jgi:hypothetical protein